MKTLSKLFEVVPIQWGLRGDPYLWEEMKIRGEKISIPETSEKLNLLLHQLFYELTGVEIEPGKNIFIPRYGAESTGMSKGFVCCNFWIETGFPLILDRYNRIV
jgi:hypothetical protein